MIHFNQHGIVGKGIRKLGASLAVGQSLPDTMYNTSRDNDRITMLNGFEIEKADRDLARRTSGVFHKNKNSFLSSIGHRSRKTLRQRKQSFIKEEEEEMDEEE